jgi:phospholipid/cholesterol/gamma-HCH transport system substrate-binding protein
MKLKFSKFERVAGLFVLTAFLGFCTSLASIALKQGWFETKVYFTTYFDNAEGVHPGTVVQISGLRAGSVEEVELTVDNKIFLKFYVFSKFAEKVRRDSIASLIRPFVIGERVIDISAGSQFSETLAADSLLPSTEAFDLMTVMSGRKLGNYLSTMSDMMGNLKALAEAFLDKNRTEALVRMFDRIEPLIKNLNLMSTEVTKMTKQMNKDERLGTVMRELATTTKQLNNILPEFSEKAPQLAADMTTLVKNLSVLTEEFKVVIPAIAQIAPDLPRVSKRAVEALDEAVVLMKALQKSYFVRGSAEEVRQEEAKKRMPSGQ